MRVLIAPLHVNFDPNYGSEASWAYNIVYGLAKEFNVQIKAICGKTTYRSTLPNLEIFETNFNKTNLLNLIIFYLKCYKLSRQFYIDSEILHHMFPFGFMTTFNPLVLFNNTSKPFVIGPLQYFQEFSDITDYELISSQRGMSATIYYNIERSLLYLFRKPLSNLQELTLKAASIIVFDSNKTLNLYKNKYSDLLNGKILCIIPPGIELNLFRYNPPIDKKHIEILMVGPLIRRKGIQYVIEAMPYIVKELRNVRLNIVGDGPYKAKLIELCKKLCIENHVIFHGRVSRNKIVHYYTNCDIFIQASLSESFPSSIREAMAVGRPIVTTDVGFCKEHVLDGINGFITQKADSKSIIESIIKLSDKNIRLKMGINARKYAEEHFNWNKIVKQWYNIYKKALSNL